MSYEPSVVALDFETALTDGTPSTEYYRPDFRVIGVAFAWRKADNTISTLVLEDYDTILAQLLRIPTNCLVVVHNFQFEFAVLKHMFPGIKLNLVDTMRLAQVCDNGGKQMAYQPKVETYDELLDAADGIPADSSHRAGLGLVACVSRFLPVEHHSHKEPYHKWLREHVGVRKGHEGAHLTSLPPNMLAEYNAKDAEVTLLLYEALTARLKDEAYDWGLDHRLYQSTATLVAGAKSTGVRVNVEALEAYKAMVEAEIAAIEEEFRSHFRESLEILESQMKNDYVYAVKTSKAQEKRLEEPAARFNLSSGKQLTKLFVEILGLKPQFWTKEPKLKPGKVRRKPFVPSPSFKSAHLSSYGTGGQILRARRKRLLVLQQTKALLKLAVYDGRWHPDIRAAGTATGRLAGGRAT